MVLGAGQTGALVARHLREHGIGRLLIVNRTLERAEQLAAQSRGEAFAWSDLDRALAAADFVITSTAAPQPLIDAARVRQAMRARQHRTFLLVDIGVPRDVEPAVRAIDNVFLHDVDGLQIMIQQTLVRRRREVPKVERIVSKSATLPRLGQSMRRSSRNCAVTSNCCAIKRWSVTRRTWPLSSAPPSNR
jgi:glutamyl-tRNA reductase